MSLDWTRLTAVTATVYNAQCEFTGGPHTATTAKAVNSTCHRVQAQIRWLDTNGSARSKTSAWLHPVASVSADTTMVTGRYGAAQINIGGTAYGSTLYAI